MQNFFISRPLHKHFGYKNFFQNVSCVRKQPDSSKAVHKIIASLKKLGYLIGAGRQI